MLSSRAAAGGSLYNLQVDALDPQACGGQGCWTNHMRVTDLDGDGSLDILLANYNDFFGGGDDPEPLVLYTNDGDGGFTNVSASALGNYAGNHHQVAVGDVDGDGARDIFGPDGSGGAYVLFINDGTGNFVDEADARLPGGPYPQGGAARFGDVDNDGDLDLFSSDGYGSDGPPWGHLYINDGTGVFEELADAIPDSIAGGDIDDVEFFDADGDLDLDLVVNAHSGGTGALWLNDGAGIFSAMTTIDPRASARSSTTTSRLATSTATATSTCGSTTPVATTPSSCSSTTASATSPTRPRPACPAASAAATTTAWSAPTSTTTATSTPW
ncbi:MAG: VCBS repeat-containing protein [Deltaproteobacteria bacterium]|nr:VCBS repeat-containing protein [Deltaproteobacteria bacterium]